MKVHSTVDPEFPVVQTLDYVHKLGCHHLVTSKDGKRAASVGFGGEVKLWRCRGRGDGNVAGESQESGKRGEEQWVEDGSVVGVHTFPLSWPHLSAIVPHRDVMSNTLGGIEVLY